jgi:acyl-CoA reductase-like NAD-dependent aldehyde dehydrogenase
MLIVDEEQFGPVLPLIKCSDIDDVINAANNSLNVLGGSAWINKLGAIQPNAPFAGVKSSVFALDKVRKVYKNILIYRWCSTNGKF